MKSQKLTLLCRHKLKSQKLGTKVTKVEVTKVDTVVVQSDLAVV
jgi:hypothetical protein